MLLSVNKFFVIELSFTLAPQEPPGWLVRVQVIADTSQAVAVLRGMLTVIILLEDPEVAFVISQFPVCVLLLVRNFKVAGMCG